MILQYDLQFFAKEGPGGEKTEPATQKKLEDARRDGQVAKSKEIANGLGLLSLFLLLKIWIGNISISFLELFGGVYNRIPEMMGMPHGTVPMANIEAVVRQSMQRLLVIMIPIFLVGVGVAFGSDVAQVKWKPTTKPLQPKFSKINPIKGFKRILSPNSLVELVKAVAKIGMILYVAWQYMKGKLEILFYLLDMPLLAAVQEIGTIVIDLGIRISSIFMIIAFADFIYQKWKFSEDMKMTKQEVKDEYKDQEGDPQIKGKQKQRMQEASRRRMMQALPEADVVITNPTHYAVALKYDSELYAAPIVLAKGADYLAARIKEEAKEYNIEIYENKPLARMLYTNVEVGEQIPAELYPAVAEVLAYVYHIREQRGGGSS